MLPTTWRLVASGLVEVHVAEAWLCERGEEGGKQARGEWQCPPSLGVRDRNNTVSNHSDTLLVSARSTCVNLVRIKLVSKVTNN